MSLINLTRDKNYSHNGASLSNQERRLTTYRGSNTERFPLGGNSMELAIGFNREHPNPTGSLVVRAGNYFFKSLSHCREMGTRSLPFLKEKCLQTGSLVVRTGNCFFKSLSRCREMGTSSLPFLKEKCFQAASLALLNGRVGFVAAIPVLIGMMSRKALSAGQNYLYLVIGIRLISAMLGQSARELAKETCVVALAGEGLTLALHADEWFPEIGRIPLVVLGSTAALVGTVVAAKLVANREPITARKAAAIGGIVAASLVNMVLITRSEKTLGKFDIPIETLEQVKMFVETLGKRMAVKTLGKLEMAGLIMAGGVVGGELGDLLGRRV
jgi:hypothetical protein